MQTTILVIIAILGAILALWAVMAPIMADSKVRGKVLNFDEGMRHYYFRLAGDGAALRAALAAGTEQTPVSYSFDGGEFISFRRENVEAAYRLRFFEKEGQSYLEVGRVAEEREPGNLPYLINAFFIQSFGAKPVNYLQFQDLFPED